jgi:hypothetical protein
MASEKNKFFFAHFLLIFLWILTGGSVISVFQRNTLLAILFAYTVFLMIISGRAIRKGLINSYLFGILLVSVCIFFNYYFSNQPQDFVKYIFLSLEFLVTGILCIYFFSIFTYEQFQLIFIKVLRFIRWHALICAVLISFFPGLFTIHLTYAYTNYNVNSFLLFFYALAKQYSFNIGGLSLVRNQGLFWEPGVLQFYLNLLLFYELYVFKSKNISVILTILVIISTYSTSAYIIVLVISSPAIFQNIKRKPGIFFPLTFLILGAFIPFMIGNLQNKFQGEKQTSSAVRVFDVVQQFEIIKDHVFAGVGLDDQQYEHIRSQYKISGFFANPIEDENAADRGSTNSILFLLAAIGLPMGFLWLYAYIKQPFIKNRKFLITFLVLTGVFVEPLLLKPFFITFIMAGFMAIYYNIRYPAKTLWLKN